MTTTAPKTIRIAIQLLFILLITALLISLFQITTATLSGIRPKVIYPYSPLSNILDFISYAAFTCVMMHFLLKRKNWARALLITYIVARLIVDLFFGSTPHSSTMVFYLMLIYYILQTIVATLLLSPESNLWFREGCPQQNATQALNTPLPTPQSVYAGLFFLLLMVIDFVAIHIAGYLTFQATAFNAPTQYFLHNATFLIWNNSVHLMVYLFFIYAIYRQHNWARVTFLLLMVLDTLLVILFGQYVFYNNTINTMGILFHVFAIIGFTLLFCPGSNQWFSRKSSPP